LDGSFFGTANAEATSALLLSYNDNLTERLHDKQAYAEAQLEEALTANDTLKNWVAVLLIITCVLATLSFFLARTVLRKTGLNRQSGSVKGF
jgi:hypothetical protein